MTLDLINFVPNTKIKASEVNTNFSLVNDELSTTQGTVEQLNNTVAIGCVPVGTVIWYAGSSDPAGYLLCDGYAYPKTAPYDTLYTVIGTTYGSADDGTKFRVPKLTDRRYIQGYVVAGEDVEGKLPDHVHGFSATTGEAGGHSHSTNGYSASISQTASYSSLPGQVCDGISSYSTTTGTDGTHTHTISTQTGLVYNNSNYGYGEYIRPKSLTLAPYIKY